MDEPLSNLDAKVRVNIRAELRQIQKSLGTTTTYVTHDQEEALAISDSIAVMNKGRVVQFGIPWEIITNLRAHLLQILLKLPILSKERHYR